MTASPFCVMKLAYIHSLIPLLMMSSEATLHELLFKTLVTKLPINWTAPI